MRHSFLLIVSAFLVFISSCGGGTSSGNLTISPPPPQPDFAISVSPVSGTVTPGGVLLAQVSVQALYGFSGSVTVNVTGLPTGATVSPSSSFAMSPGTQDVIVNIPSNATLGSFTVALQASSGSLQHSVSVALQIQTATLAGFSIYVQSDELSFNQGGSASAAVFLEAVGIGNTNFEVQLSITGLPAGVQATLGENPLPYGGPPASLKFTADSTALANYAIVTVTAIRTTDSVQKSAQFELSVTPPVGSLPAIRTDFVREDGTPNAAVYDPVHKVIYASNPQQNRIDVISEATHQIVKSIPAPNPTGMDLSVDGSHLFVTSDVQQIISIDTTSLQVVSRTSVPAQTGNLSSIPDLIANTANGTTLIGMTYHTGPPSYTLEQWNPAAGTFTPLTAPGIGPWINRMVRTGDGSKVLVVDYGTDLNLAVYDSASNSFTASGPSPVGQVIAVAASPTSDQFAIIGYSGFVFVDSNLNVLAEPALGAIIWGMTYSPDGKSLYVAATIQYSLAGPLYPAILTFDTSTYSLAGAAPAFQFAPLFTTSQATLQQSIPFTADATGLIYGTFQSGHGLLIDDATNFQNVLNLPVGPATGAVGIADEAPLNTTLATTLGQAGFDALPDVWFGNARGTNIEYSTGPLVSVTAPASTTAGLVNVTGVEPDGWFFLVPQAFSYGSQILSAGGNAGSTQGGASLALVGYGLIGDGGSPTVTIGGQLAKVTAASKYVYFNDSGYNAGYPFLDVDELMVTIPPGAPGIADISVTSSAGTTKLARAFNYVAVADYSSSDSFTNILYDPKRQWVYLSAGNHIDVFSAESDQFLTPIVPPSLSGSRQIMGLALTPDNSTLLAANYTDSSVAIIDPDNPANSKAVQIPVSVDNPPGVADVVATNTGEAFVDGTSTALGSCGGQLWELNLSTLKATLRTEVTNVGASGNAFSRTATGDQVLIGSGGCSPNLWNSATDTFTHSLALVNDSRAASGDGHWFASDYTRLDANMVEQIQAQPPEFFGDLVYADLSGEKMNASGSLLYTPVPQGSGTAESNGIQITDTNLGQSVGYIPLVEQLPTLVQNVMDFDEAGNRLFLITSAGLTIVQLPSPPLSIGYLSPATGPVAGGTTVTIRGSGFESGATVSLGGVETSATYVDSSTLQFVTPSGSAGGARISIKNPDGTSYVLDAGFTYQ